MLVPYSIVVDRVCGRAELEVHLSEDGQHMAWVRMPEARGFEAFLCGRPAEEVPMLASRISAICPWPHHLAAMSAVEEALGVCPPPAAQKVRELGLLLSTLSDRFMLFYVTNAPDVIVGEDQEKPNIFSLTQHPNVRKAILLRTRLQRLLHSLTGPSLAVGSVVVGGLNKPVDKELVRLATEYLVEIRQFCLQAMRRVRKDIFPAMQKRVGHLEDLHVPMLGSVGEKGVFTLWEGDMRYMLPDGYYEDMSPAHFMDSLVEEHADWTQCAFPRRKDESPVSLDPDNPRGLYRVGPLPRINICTHMTTPQAQAALEDFRLENGPRPQAALLYHWARFIEMVYCCERAEELLRDPGLLDKDVREENIMPRAGTGIGRVEAPRGSLFYRLTLDEEGLVRHCNIITPTTQNNAAMNVFLTQAARKIITVRPPTREHWHTLSMCLRLYDPSPTCAVH